MELSLTAMDYLLKGSQVVTGLLALLPLKPQWKLVIVPLALALAGPYLLPMFEALRTGNLNAEAHQNLQLEHWPEVGLAFWLAFLATVQCHTLFVVVIEPLKDWVSPQWLWKQAFTAVVVVIVLGASLNAYALFYSSRANIAVCDVSAVILLASVLAVALPVGDGMLSLLPYQGAVSRIGTVTLALLMTASVGIVLVVWFAPQDEDWFTTTIATLAVTWTLLENIRFSLGAYYASRSVSDSKIVPSALIATVEERNICEVCSREFPTGHGLAIHSGRMHKA